MTELPCFSAASVNHPAAVTTRCSSACRAGGQGLIRTILICVCVCVCVCGLDFESRIRQQNFFMLSAWINVRQTDAGDLTAAQLCCTCYSPGVRADAIWVSRHKHGRGVSGAVLFITRIVINGSPGPSQSAGLEPRIKILHSDWVAVQRARWVIGIAVIILLDISSWTPHLSAPSARIIRCICWMLTSAQS